MNKGYLHLLFTYFLLLIITSATYAQKSLLTINLDSTVASGISLSPDGNYIAGACQDKVVRIWKTSDGSLVQTLEGHKSAVLSADFCPDGKYLATGGWDHIVKIWDLSTGKVFKNLDDNTDRINCIRYSPDGAYIASASEDGRIIIWNTSTYKNPLIIDKHKQAVNDITFSADSRYLASASWDRTVGFYEVISGTQVFSFAGHLSGVNSVSFSNDGWYIASGSDDHTVNLWDIKERKLLQTFSLRNDGVVYSVSFNPTGNFILSGNENSSVDIWNIKKMQYKTSVTGHKGQVTSIEFVKKGDIMASASDDKTIVLWDMSDLKYEQCYEEKMKAYSYLAKPKDEFETSEQYQSRMDQFAKVKAGLRTECEIEATTIQQAKLQASYSWVTLTIQNLSEYDADQQQYIVTVNNERFPLKMSVADAKTFKAQWTKAKVRGIKKVNPENKKEEYFNLKVIHPVSQVGYPFGTQVSPDDDPYLNSFLKKNPK